MHKYRPNRSLLLLIFATTLTIIGCSNEDATNSSTSPLSPGDTQYNWFFVNYNAYSHEINIDVNGKPLMTMNGGSGFDSKPNPLVNGENLVAITCNAKENKPFPNTEVRILLSPNMIVGAAPLPGVELAQIENYTEIQLYIDVDKNVPQTFRYLLSEWASSDKETILYKLEVDKDAFMRRPLKEQVSIWTEQGQPYREVQYEEDKIIKATYYKPDGSIGAQVKDGTGNYREWYRDGTLLLEAPIKDGNYTGIVKEFAEDGTISRKLPAEQWIQE